MVGSSSLIVSLKVGHRKLIQFSVPRWDVSALSFTPGVFGGFIQEVLVIILLGFLSWAGQIRPSRTFRFPPEEYKLSSQCSGKHVSHRA